MRQGTKLLTGQERSATPSRSQRKKLLIVDDEVAVLIAFKKIFRGHPVEIDTADTIEQAISMIDAKRYEAVIADLRLSGILGQEGLRILQHAKEKNVGTRLIMITGYGSPDIMKRAYALGADFYCEKPVSMESFQKALKSMGII